MPYTLLRRVSGLPHFGHVFFSFSSMSTFFVGQSGLMQSVCGRFPFLKIFISGYVQCSHVVVIGSNFPGGSLKVALHSGYLSHAMNLPYFPRLMTRLPFLHLGQSPMVSSACRVSWNVCLSPSPIACSFFLKSSEMSIMIFFALSSISCSCLLLWSMSSISSSKCRVSSSSTIFGQCCSSIFVKCMPRSVAMMDSFLM